MCGIAGVWRKPGQSHDHLLASARDMADRMHHRGPDDGGAWADERNGLAFGFRRLAIIDLSANGHQPMPSPTGRFTMVFNGEIYNHTELAAKLRPLGYQFRGHSDTEVALAAFEEWGIEAAVAQFIGMFAIAVWDSDERTLHLLRDRLGIKPLYIYHGQGITAFASEPKAFLALPEFSPELDPESLAAYFRYLYVPAPASIFRGVSKLLPGHRLILRGPDGTMPESSAFWDLDSIAHDPRALEFADDSELVDALEDALIDAVRLRLRADVPVGAFLSGGIDSSTVVALMQEVSPRPVRTYTIGFDVDRHDESSEALAIARHLGTDHQQIRLTGTEALSLVPRIPEIFDEPLADPSQIPTYLICSASRRDVTVALSGDGGDELFGGYNRYAYGTGLIQRALAWPEGARRVVAAGLTSFSPGTWDRLHGGVNALLRRPSQRLVGEKVHKTGQLLRSASQDTMYRSLVSAWQHPPIFGHDGNDRRASRVLRDPSLSLLERMMLADQRGYLADDLLAKVDRTSMAVSLEVRVPILDHRVVELSWKLPAHAKLRDGRTKWILRQVLERRVPRALIDRPKVGFTVPLADWLRGPLAKWAEDRLLSDRLADTPSLDTRRIRQAWRDFQVGKTNDQLGIWTVLMFESWRERWLR